MSAHTERESDTHTHTHTHTRGHPLLRSRRRLSPSTSKPVAVCETVYTLRAVVCKEAWFIHNRRKSGRGV